jgi:hypothetical protein
MDNILLPISKELARLVHRGQLGFSDIRARQRWSNKLNDAQKARKRSSVISGETAFAASTSTLERENGPMPPKMQLQRTDLVRTADSGMNLTTATSSEYEIFD